MKKSIGSGRGSVYNILLKALQTGDKYGYEICKEIEEKSNGAYILKQPSLYSGLKRLEAQKLITSYWRDSDLGGRRHYYSLTDAGRQKIEGSNFSWEDTRDNLVNSLFEKSEIENDIDEVTKQVDELKEQTQNTSEIQTDIDDIISSTQNLADKKQEILQNVDKAEEIDSAFTYNQSDDLFSIFSNYSSCKETVENDTVKQNVEQNVEQNNEITDNQIEEDLVTAQDENNVFEEINEEQINEEEIYFDDINDKEAKDVVDNNLQDEQLDLFSFINTQQEQKIEDQDEEIFDGIDEDDYNDIIKNFTTYQNTEQEITDQTELTIKQEQDVTDASNNFDIENNVTNDVEKESVLSNTETFSNQILENELTTKSETQNFESADADYLEQYRNNRQTTSSFVENSKVETTENTFFNQNYEDSSFSLENTNFDFSTTTSTEDIVNQEEVATQENLSDNLTTTANLQNDNNIDYQNIFGDLMTSSTQVNETEMQPEEKIDTDVEKQVYQDDLPRVSLENNVNRTFVVDDNMIEEINQNYFNENPNPFEKFDKQSEENVTEQNTFEQPTQQFQQQIQRNLPFDKKYNNVFNHFEVPDYQVRYYKKPTNHKAKESKFISINKLNLVSNLILCILMCLFATTGLILSSQKVEISTAQTVFYVLSFVLSVGVTLFHFLKYIANKNKKAISLNKHETIYNTFFAVVIIILAVAINILFGMNLTNILNYSATFILPVCFALLLLIAPLIKKFLSKFSSFYLN